MNFWFNSNYPSLLNVNKSPQLATKPTHLYISNRVPVGSTIYTHRTRIVSPLTATAFFQLKGNHVLLSQPLTLLTADTVILDLVLSNSILSLHIHIIENTLQLVQFSRPVYYFSALAPGSQIGSLQLSPMNLIDREFIQLQSVQLISIRCVTKGTKLS